MIDNNNALVLQCIMKLIKCDLKSAIKFAEHNQTCYNLAMAVAQAKDNEPDGYCSETNISIDDIRWTA